MSAERILVTGGAGFVGSNLARRLQDSRPDSDLLVVDDFRSGSFDNLIIEDDDGWSYRGRLIARPLEDLDLARLVDRFEPDVIFHQASITDTTVSDEAEMVASNVEPFEALLEAAIERGTRLVWASSAATYGIEAGGAAAEKRPFQLEDAGRPANVYGFSKWLMENAHRRALEATPEAHVVGLRYFNVFGPGERHKEHMASMVYKLARQMLGGERPRIFHDGEQARDQVYVRDVVACTLAASDPDAASGVYNVGTGTATTFNQLVALLNEALGTRYAPDYFDNPFSFYQAYTRADVSETHRGLGWAPRYSPREAILEYGARLRRRYGRGGEPPVGEAGARRPHEPVGSADRIKEAV